MDASNRTCSLPGSCQKLDDVKTTIWTFVLPSFCLFGLIANLFNLYIFSHRNRLSNQIYRYLEMHSFVETIYMLLSFVHFALRPSLNNTYMFKIYHLYLFEFLTTLLATFNIFVELIISFQRLLAIRHSRFVNKLNVNVKLIITCLLISALINLPILIFCQIKVKLDDSQRLAYYLSYEKITSGSSKLSRLLILVSVLFRGLFSPIVVVIVNILMIAKFKKRMKIKQNISKRRFKLRNGEQILWSLSVFC